MDTFKEGAMLIYSDSDCTNPWYSDHEKIQPRDLVEKNSIVTEENIPSESSEEINFRKIFEHCNVEWLKNLQKEINKNFKYIEKV